LATQASELWKWPHHVLELPVRTTLPSTEIELAVIPDPPDVST
jgi:hypothetical protein